MPLNLKEPQNLCLRGMLGGLINPPPQSKICLTPTAHLLLGSKQASSVSAVNSTPFPLNWDLGSQSVNTAALKKVPDY